MFELFASWLEGQHNKTAKATQNTHLGSDHSIRHATTQNAAPTKIFGDRDPKLDSDPSVSLHGLCNTPTQRVKIAKTRTNNNFRVPPGKAFETLFQFCIVFKFSISTWFHLQIFCGAVPNWMVQNSTFFGHHQGTSRSAASSFYEFCVVSKSQNQQKKPREGYR